LNSAVGRDRFGAAAKKPKPRLVSRGAAPGIGRRRDGLLRLAV